MRGPDTTRRTRHAGLAVAVLLAAQLVLLGAALSLPRAAGATLLLLSGLLGALLAARLTR